MPMGLLGQVLPFAPEVFLLVGDEPDGPLGRLGRRHEFAQRAEDLLELIAGVAAEGGQHMGHLDGAVLGVVAHGRGGLQPVS